MDIFEAEKSPVLSTFVYKCWVPAVTSIDFVPGDWPITSTLHSPLLSEVVVPSTVPFISTVIFLWGVAVPETVNEVPVSEEPVVGEDIETVVAANAFNGCKTKYINAASPIKRLFKLFVFVPSMISKYYTLLMLVFEV